MFYTIKIKEWKWGRRRPNNFILVLISPTVFFQIQGNKISQKTAPPLIFGEILTRLCCPGETLDSQLKEIF